jgi:hypothetical protein
MATQVNYAMQCVQKVVEKKARSISVAEETNAKYVSERFLAHTGFFKKTLPSFY